MKRAAAAGLFLAGIILLYLGYQEYQSVVPNTPRLLGGTAPNTAIFLIAGGVAGCISGFAGLLRGGDADQSRL